MTKIILIRHAQSIKNIKDIHGGNGEELTALGKEQTEKLVIKLLNLGVCHSNSVISYPQNIQAKETAEIISKKLTLPHHYISDFRPLNLGIVHGLSNEIVANSYPYVYDLLSQWRNKKIEICDLTIPGMENPMDFYNRGLKVLGGLIKEKYNIFVATNSLYILLLNILLGNTCEKNGGYIHFDIPNCGLTMFEESIDGNFIPNLDCTDVEDVICYINSK